MTLNEMYSYDSIGSLMKDRRKELNLTQNDVADQLCISAKALSKIETGHNSLSFEHLPVLKKVLKIPEPVLKDIACKSFTFGEENCSENIEEILVDVTEQEIEKAIATLERGFWRQREYPLQPDDDKRYDVERIIDDLRYKMDKDGRVLERYQATSKELDLLCHIHNYLGADLRKGFDARLVETAKASLYCKNYYKEDYDPSIILDYSWPSRGTDYSLSFGLVIDGSISDEEFAVIENRLREVLNALSASVEKTKSWVASKISAADDATKLLLLTLLTRAREGDLQIHAETRRAYSILVDSKKLFQGDRRILVDDNTGVKLVATDENILEQRLFNIDIFYFGEALLTQEKRNELWKDESKILKYIQDRSYSKEEMDSSLRAYQYYSKYRAYPLNIREKAFETAFEILDITSMSGKHEAVTIDELMEILQVMEEEMAS